MATSQYAAARHATDMAFGLRGGQEYAIEMASSVTIEVQSLRPRIVGEPTANTQRLR